MYNFDHHMLPPLFDRLFIKASEIHTYSFRASYERRSEYDELNIAFNSMKCLGLQIYSKIPLDIISQSSFSIFKNLWKPSQLNNVAFDFAPITYCCYFVN